MCGELVAGVTQHTPADRLYVQTHTVPLQANSDAEKKLCSLCILLMRIKNYFYILSFFQHCRSFAAAKDRNSWMMVGFGV